MGAPPGAATAPAMEANSVTEAICPTPVIPAASAVVLTARSTAPVAQHGAATEWRVVLSSAMVLTGYPIAHAWAAITATRIAHFKIIVAARRKWGSE